MKQKKEPSQKKKKEKQAKELYFSALKTIISSS